MRRAPIKKRYPLVILLGCFLFWSIPTYFGVLINITPSMQKGLYRVHFGEIARGDIVSFCLPKHAEAIGLERRYIDKGKACGKAYPLIKKVIALPHDEVEITSQEIIVNNHRYPFRTLPHDAGGRDLESIPRGKYVDTQGYWLIGTESSQSWDSRYFGWIKKKWIKNKIVKI